MAPGLSGSQSSSTPALGLREQLAVMYRGYATLPEPLPNHDEDDDEDEKEAKGTDTTDEPSDARNASSSNSSDDTKPVNGENETDTKVDEKQST
ncbi:Nn.00g024410.m01.CDS01 [Neocucurbitaria sp. VM-36]